MKLRGAPNTIRLLSVAASALALPLCACVQETPAMSAWMPIPRPSPDDPTPSGIAYVCEGAKEVSVVYAKNRASVTLDKKTWRMEYQASEDGFRYTDNSVQWVGSDELASLRESFGNARPIAYNCRPARRTS
jgi:membrane-bound inhibitor of C-type lysozyme